MLQAGSSSSSSVTTSSDAATWVWITMVVPLGVTSVVSICSNAMSCYNFFIAWNMISQMHRQDLELLRNNMPAMMVNCYRRRRVEIDAALHSRPYEEFQKTSTCKEGCADACSICLCEFQDTDIVSSSKKDGCDHIFHKDCLRLWLQKHPSCPYCRMELLPPVVVPPAAPPVVRSSSFIVGW